MKIILYIEETSVNAYQTVSILLAAKQQFIILCMLKLYCMLNIYNLMNAMYKYAKNIRTFNKFNAIYPNTS